MAQAPIPSVAALSGLDKARNRFRGLVLERTLAFETFRSAALAGEDLPASLTNIADLAHKISGVGATLGFVEAGGCAGTVERYILENRAKLTSPAQFQAQVEPLLESLLVALEDLLDD